MKMLAAVFPCSYTKRQHEPPAPCRSVLVGAGQGRERGAGLWPPGPTADLSGPPGQTGRRHQSDKHVVLCRGVAVNTHTHAGKLCV